MKRLFLLLLGLLLTGTALPATQNEPPPLSIERLFSATRPAFPIPRHIWTAQGTLILSGNHQPLGARTWEQLDPATGQRSTFCDMERCLEALKKALEGSGGKVPTELPWPSDWDDQGNRALFTFGSDLYLFVPAEARIKRLTHSPEEKVCPTFSPDGTRLAFARNHDLWVLDLATGQERPLTTDGSDTRLNATLSWVYWEEIFGRSDNAFWWSPDGKSIAFFQTDETPVEETVFPGYEPATAAIKRQRYPKAGGHNPFVRLGIVDLASGDITWARLGDPAPEYLTRVTWHPDSLHVAVQTLNRHQNGLDLLLVDRTTGTSRRILHESSEKSLNIVDDFQFLKNGTQFIWASERSGRNGLYLYNMDGTLIRPLTPTSLHLQASSSMAWIRGGLCAVDEKNGFVYFTAVEKPPFAPQLYRTSLEGGDATRLGEAGGTHRVSFRPDAAYFLDEFSSCSNPPGLALFQSDGTRKAMLSEPDRNQTRTLGLVFPEFLNVPTADGAQLPVHVLKPRNLQPGRRYPVIFYVYGGPSAPVVKDVWQRDILFDNLLLQEGFIRVDVDNRSASGFSTTLEDTAYGHLIGEQAIADIQTVVDWVCRQPWADPSRLGIWGWSGGGTTTMQMMTHTTSFKAGISVAGVSDFRYYDSVWTENTLGLPDENPAGYQESSPAFHAAKLHGKILLVHGTHDDNVHPQNVWRFADELIRAGIPFEMQIYPLSDHGIAAPGARRHLYARMLDFWKKNL